MTRKVLKDITLHDGTFLPKNTIVAAASVSTHYDGNIYADAETFDPFRFARMRTGEGESTKHQFVNTSTEYIPFGHGKHAWCVVPPLTMFEQTLRRLTADTVLGGSLRQTS